MMRIICLKPRKYSFEIHVVREMEKNTEYSFKICLVGEGGVGKTSLIKRFVYDEFSDKYISTIGTKITKKDLTVSNKIKNTSFNVKMMVWDIMGQQGFRKVLQDAYFYGCQGALAICDITRKETLDLLDDWVKSIYSVAGEVPIVFLANKCDLKEKAELNFDNLKELSSKYKPSKAFLSSAKNGLNVNLAFKTLGEEIIEGWK